MDTRGQYHIKTERKRERAGDRKTERGKERQGEG